uniref:histidine kinase n=1 Tax=Oryza glumipatula TaxID=40148 RepID=A0A0E0A800_9ORYZ
MEARAGAGRWAAAWGRAVGWRAVEDAAAPRLHACQRVSDLLIVASFLSFPFELFYFATCADLSEVKCAVLHFCAFIILCGATNLLAAFTHALPHSAPLLRALTTAKVLAVAASSAVTVSLPTFIPKLLYFKVRESLLRDKASWLHYRDLGLGLVRHHEEATSRVVRELTGQIRGSPPDPHAILRTTALQLADALGLHACAVWMPAAGQPHDLVLMHNLTTWPDAADLLLEVGDACTVTTDDPDMVDVTEASYTILVLLPPHDTAGGWSSHDLEIVQAVARVSSASVVD